MDSQPAAKPGLAKKTAWMLPLLMPVLNPWALRFWRSLCHRIVVGTGFVSVSFYVGAARVLLKNLHTLYFTRSGGLPPKLEFS